LTGLLLPSYVLDMAKTYTKLEDSILDSTIWQENSDTKVVWITLLAMADWDGNVAASVPGIAKRAGVSLEATEKAMDRFMAPDAHSRNKANEGRRIAPIHRGFFVLNFPEHRDSQLREARREYFRTKKRQYRVSNDVQDMSETKLDNVGKSTYSDSDRDSDLDRDGSERIAVAPPRSRAKKAYSEAFELFWGHTEACRGNKGAAWKAWEKAIERPALKPLCAAWDAYMASQGPSGGFVQHVSTWLNQRGWETDWRPAAPPRTGQQAKSDRTTDSLRAWALRGEGQDGR
jgi:hypothetical protein